MNPNTVFSASLVTSLVLWFPSMQACLRGDLDLAPAGLRYLAALLASRLAVGFLARLVSAYHPAQHPVGPPAVDASPPASRPGTAPPSTSTESRPAAPKRRRSDHSPDGDPDPGATLAA